jgi:hemerythrin-like domain-containing protein
MVVDSAREETSWWVRMPLIVFPWLESQAVSARKERLMRVLDRRDARAAKTPRRPEGGRRAERDGLALLRAEHEDLQSEYEGFQTSGGDDRYFLASRLLRQLSQHGQIEADVFYPALQRQAERQGHRKALALVREALREHRAMDRHMDRLNDVMQDDLFLRQVEDLMQEVQAHVGREERDLFPLAQTLLGESGLARLGRELRQRKEAIGHQFAA